MESEQLSVLLERVNGGDANAFHQLVSVTYLELRKVAGSMMRAGRSGQTLQPTALVNEAYLRLACGNSRFESRAHFFGAAARAMRQVLAVYARHKSAKKRASGLVRIDFDDVAAAEPGDGMERLDEALTALGRIDPELLSIMELRYFAGRSLAEVADLMGCSLATVKRRWTYARAWLHDYMTA